MDHHDELHNQMRDLQRAQEKSERDKKWAERGEKFWRVFLFTENGKPKSGFLVYTFCLSLVYVFLLVGLFWLITDWRLESVPVVLGNLIQSLLAGGAAVLIGLVLHRLFTDKRLMLGCYLWLTLYLAAILVTLLIMLSGTGTSGLFLDFFLWFMAIPVLLGLAVFYVRYKKDYIPPQPKDLKPWEKSPRDR